jgi:hypothetical protein
MRCLRHPEIIFASYLSGSFWAAPHLRGAYRSAGLAWKATQMYFKKISPRTTCLYSAPVHVVASGIGGRPQIGPQPLSPSASPAVPPRAI